MLPFDVVAVLVLLLVAAGVIQTDLLSGQPHLALRVVASQSSEGSSNATNLPVSDRTMAEILTHGKEAQGPSRVSTKSRI